MDNPAPPVTLIRGWSLSPFLAVDGDIDWQQYYGRLYGRFYPRPRLERWMCDLPRPYRFGGSEIASTPLTGVADSLRRRLEAGGFGRFNSCMANRYADGSHSVSWHADDEAGIGPVIASISFGGTRKFRMKPKPGYPGAPITYEVAHGDLLIMEAGCQERWLHCVPKTRKEVQPRINLTFRFIEK